MDLHRTGKTADWDHVSPGRHNGWQRLAAQTHGILAPGNVVSSVGLTLVFVGLVFVLRHEYWAGLALIGLGRIADILDGIVADHTGTKSPLGETIDATFDKIGAFAVLIVLVVQGLLPWIPAVVIGLQSLANIVVAYLGRKENIRLHPSKCGKLSAVGIWLGIMGFAVVKPLEQHGWHTASTQTNIVAYIITAAAIAFGLRATWYYAKNAKLVKR